MECKSDAGKGEYMSVVELIETLWNVNFGMSYKLDESAQELIETLWRKNILLSQ